MDIGALLVASVAMFFVLAVCLVNVVISLKAKENTDAVRAELRDLRKQIDRLTSGPR